MHQNIFLLRDFIISIALCGYVIFIEKLRNCIILDLGYVLTSPSALAEQNPSFDLVVDCSGSAAAMQQAIKWLNMGGKLMVFGVANPKAVME